jgi:signal transduction histidine kinase
MIFFIFLHRFFAEDIQRRSDAWLSGEVEVLGNVAERTPKDALYGRVLGEVAELVRKEIPNRMRSERGSNDSVFFLQVGENGSLKLWVGAGNSENTLNAIQASGMAPDLPSDLRVDGFALPFRVVSTRLEDGSRIYLGFSKRDELRVLANLRFRFAFLWLLTVLLGFVMVFLTTRGMLSRVQAITESASQIGKSGLNVRVPTTQRRDEVAHLALTLNRMLDRIQNSIHQLHTITDSLAHDLRSPLTAIRGRLEMSLSTTSYDALANSVISAVEEIDRLTDFLNRTLDVSEAKADALRLARSEIDLDALVKVMIELYGPTMTEKRMTVRVRINGPIRIEGDASLIHRMIGNLIDNELKHLPDACTVTIRLEADHESASLILEDDGPGFAAEISSQLFQRRVKGIDSKGHGLGLAFVDAVARAHGGSVTASNREEGGARVAVTLPLARVSRSENSTGDADHSEPRTNLSLSTQ